MRSTVTSAAWLLSVLASAALLQGCVHKDKTPPAPTLAPPIVDTPPQQPSTVSAANLPPPEVVEPAKPATAPPPKPQEQPKKPAHHTRKPASSNPQPTQTQEASANPGGSSASPIGELSGPASGDQRTEAEDTINTTEKGLNGINRRLSDTETKTAAQIKEFLKQARTALNSGDVDGALTLAKKAKVLLAELSQ